ncbi:MAG: hypothetical protein R3240_00265 [Gammaproteobacteria bacterium]|nr:hypothetical protein [Gammaproteobacteria bacterium]
MTEHTFNYQQLDIANEGGYIVAKPKLGEEDSVTQWNNGLKPADTFLHTDSYSTFQNDKIILLLGRRGTGKTAIIRMLDHEITTGQMKQYSLSCIVDSEDAFSELSTQIRSSPFFDFPSPDLINLLKNKWHFLFKIFIMQSLFDKNKHIAAKAKTQDLFVIKNYLQQEGLLDKGDALITTDPLLWFSNTIVEELIKIEYNHQKLGAVIAGLVKKSLTVEFKEAEKALKRILDKEIFPALIMLDSLERYDINDRITQNIIVSLLEAARGLYNNKSLKILAKVALPSEIKPYLILENADKYESMTIEIKWSYKNLLTMLAKRFYQNFEKNITHEELEKVGYKDGRNYIYEYIPDVVLTRGHIPIDTLIYVMRHTQKVPRQVIQLFNLIFTYADEVHDVSRIKESEIIRKGVHIRLDTLISGVFCIYNAIQPQLDSVLRSILTDMYSEFSHEELDKAIRDNKEIWKPLGLTKERIIELMLETGILGILVNNAENGEQEHSNIRICEGEFQYQLAKSRMNWSRRSTFVIHPMFYEEYRCYVDLNTFCYPRPEEEERIHYS